MFLVCFRWWSSIQSPRGACLSFLLAGANPFRPSPTSDSRLPLSQLVLTDARTDSLVFFSHPTFFLLFLLCLERVSARLKRSLFERSNHLRPRFRDPFPPFNLCLPSPLISGFIRFFYMKWSTPSAAQQVGPVLEGGVSSLFFSPLSVHLTHRR